MTQVKSNTKYKVDQRVVTQVRGWSIGRSKNKNTPYVQIDFENYIRWTGYHHPNSVEKLMEVLEICGFKGADLSMLRHDDALDKTIDVAAVIESVREYKGKFYHDAKWINNISNGGFDTDVDQATIDDFADLDTRAYITDAKEDSKPADQHGMSDNEYNGDNSFTADDIPF